MGLMMFLAILVLCTTGWQWVLCQANVDNPLVWQISVSYNVTQVNAPRSYDTTTSVKLYSQDFQTVYAKDDYFGRNERLLVDFGDACPGTRLEDVLARNGNTAIRPRTTSQPLMALVARGGRCSQWSEKIDVTQGLSDENRLGVAAILVYDNMTGSATQLVREATTNVSYPVWQSPLPLARNVSHMPDNDLNRGRTFVAVYFAPLQYGTTLLQTLQNTRIGDDGMLRLIQLTVFLGEVNFLTGSGTSEQDGSANNDDNRDDMWSLFSGNRSYIAYLIAAVAAIFLSIILFRWCRTRRNVASRELEESVILQTLGPSPDTESKCIALDQLNTLSSVMDYKDALCMKNVVCAICLEDFKPACRVRVLPCHHGFCAACVDTWLTKKSSLCPICKHDCAEKAEKSATSTESTTQCSTVSAIPTPISPMLAVASNPIVQPRLH